MKTNKKILIFLLTMVVSLVLAANAEAYLGSSTRKPLQYKDLTKRVFPAGVPGSISESAASKGSALQRCKMAAINAANTFIGVTVGPDGKFNMGGLQPSPWDLLFNWPFGAPWSSFTTVQIDGTNYVYGETAPGTWIQAPQNVRPPEISVSGRLAPIIITQTLEIVSTASSTGNADVLKVQYTVQNTDTASTHRWRAGADGYRG